MSASNDLEHQFYEYTQEVREQAVYPCAHGANTIINPHLNEMMYLALGLAGEAGEAADVIKKMWRLNEYPPRQELKDKLLKEMGDELWYYTRIMDVFGFSWQDIMDANMKKLRNRVASGTVHHHPKLYGVGIADFFKDGDRNQKTAGHAMVYGPCDTLDKALGCVPSEEEMALGDIYVVEMGDEGEQTPLWKWTVLEGIGAWKSVE